MSRPSPPGSRRRGRLLDYVQETQKASAGHVVRLEPSPPRGEISSSTRRPAAASNDPDDPQQRAGRSLLEAIDETSTAMGARLLADWLSNP